MASMPPPVVAPPQPTPPPLPQVDVNALFDSLIAKGLITKPGAAAEDKAKVTEGSRSEGVKKEPAEVGWMFTCFSKTC